MADTVPVMELVGTRARVAPAPTAGGVAPRHATVAVAVAADSLHYFHDQFRAVKRVVTAWQQQQQQLEQHLHQQQGSILSSGGDGAAAIPMPSSPNETDLGEVLRTLDEMRRCLHQQLRLAERGGLQMAEERDRANAASEQLHIRNSMLMKELAFVRHEVEAARAEAQRLRVISSSSSSAGLTALGDSKRLERIERDLADARALVVRHEARSLEQAADLANMLKAAADNHAAALRCDTVQARFDALAAKHQTALLEWHRERQQQASALNNLEGRLTLAKQHTRALQQRGLTAIAMAAAIRSASTYFHRWRNLRDFAHLRAELEQQRHQASLAAKSASEAEREVGVAKIKYHRKVDELQTLLDSRRAEVQQLTERNESLSGKVTTTMTRRVANAEGDLMASQPAADGSSSASGAQALQIEALEAYNELLRVLKSFKQRLNLRCVTLMPLQMHTQTTSSVVAMVVGWVKEAATNFGKLLMLESRMAKLRTRLVCSSVGIRGKTAAIAVKLSLPVGTLEGQLLRTKKDRYDELLVRIRSLRAKVESAKENVYNCFNVKDIRPALEIVEKLEREVDLFARILRSVEADQFQLSLQLTKARMDESKRNAAKPQGGMLAPDPSDAHAARSAGAGAPAVGPLADSKALVIELRGLLPAVGRPAAHTPQPTGDAPSHSVGRHNALTPLEDLVDSDVHRRMRHGTLNHSFRPSYAPSTTLRDRAYKEREAAKDPNNKKLIFQPVGMAKRGGAVIPFRESPPQPSELSAANKIVSVRITDQLMR